MRDETAERAYHTRALVKFSDGSIGFYWFEKGGIAVRRFDWMYNVHGLKEDAERHCHCLLREYEINAQPGPALGTLYHKKKQLHPEFCPDGRIWGIYYAYSAKRGTAADK